MNKTSTTTTERVHASLKRRNAAEKRFQLYGIGAIAVALLFLGFLFATVFGNGIGALQQTKVALKIHFDEAVIDPEGTRDTATMLRADYLGIVKKALREQFSDVKARRDKRKLYELVSSGAAFELADMVAADPSLIGRTQNVWLTASDDIDMAMKGNIKVSVPEAERRVSDKQFAWVGQLKNESRIELQFNSAFFFSGDSREPELAGVLGAVSGSFFSLLVCLILAFPVGLLAATYLEEFAPKNRWTEFIEVNINNLAAVPSIVFGLLGLAFFLNVLQMPRSAPMVGGMVLALMTLPTIIIAARSALKSVPPSIREAALGLGASPVQVVFHHVVPLALPGIMTGTIIGMARALGETAPLLMIGMVAFIVDVPKSMMDPATALPVQVYLWADSPERAFEERTAAAIIVLLVFLVAMNALAVYLRKRFEIRW